MRRRTLVASLPAGAIASVAGCLDWTTSYRTVSLEPVDYERFTDGITRGGSDLRPSPLVENLVSSVLDGDSIELEVLGDFTLFDGSTSGVRSSFHYWNGDAVYRFSRERLERGDVTGPEYEISRVHRLPDDVSPNDDEEVLSFSDLPRYEQWRVHDPFVFDDGRLIHFSGSTIIGYLDPEWESESLLFDGISQRFLEFNDRYVELTEGREKTASIERIRFSVERTAPDAQAFAERHLDEHAVDAASLSEDTRDVLAEVQDNGGSVTTSDEDSEYEDRKRTIEELRSERKDANTAVTRGQAMYIRYEGEYYLLRWGSHTAP